MSGGFFQITLRLVIFIVVTELTLQPLWPALRDYFYIGTSENCTKTKLHEESKLHEDNFAPRVNFARVAFFHESKKKLKKN